LRYSEALEVGFNVDALWDEPLENTIAGYNSNAGKAMCATIGFVPTANEMRVLRNTHYTSPETTGELNKWPAAHPYLVQKGNGNGFEGFNISTGATATSPSGTYYLTCVANQNLGLEMTSRQVTVNTESKTIGEISKSASTNIEIIEVDTGLPNDLTAVDVSISTLGTGERLSVTTQSTKAGVYRFKVVNRADPNDSVSSPIIEYIADEETAFLKSLAPVEGTDNATPDGVDTVSILATVVDRFTNPVGFQEVEFDLVENGEISDTVSVIGAGPHYTDGQGEVTVKVANTEAETVEVTARVTSSAGTSVLDTTVTFGGLPPEGETGGYPSFCHQFPGVADLNCLPTTALKSGKIFTANPSRQFMKDAYPTVAYDEEYYERSRAGVVGTFVMFDRNRASSWCNALRATAMYGRTNWRLAGLYELRDELYAEYPNLSEKRGWPVQQYYITNTVATNPFDVKFYYKIGMSSGTSDYDANRLVPMYASCVSNPQD